MQYILLILGLVMIIRSADVLIDSSAKIAKRYGISPFIIGITVVAFGTSAPELSVGIISGITKTNQLTLGNIIGSSLANTAMIIGLTAIIMPLKVKDSVVKRELPILLGVQIILSGMLFADGILSQLDGCILIMGFIGFVLYIIKDSKNSMKTKNHLEETKNNKIEGGQTSQEVLNMAPIENLLKLWSYSLISLVGLFLGGKLTVDSSTNIAMSLGLSETMIGLTVVAIATTMPELITSVVAATKKEPDIVIGNCIGSNIFNILLVLGLSGAISPIPTDMSLWVDITIMLILTVFIFTITWIRKKIKRGSGIVLLITYFLYLVFKVVTAIQLF